MFLPFRFKFHIILLIIDPSSHQRGGGVLLFHGKVSEKRIMATNVGLMLSIFSDLCPKNFYQYITFSRAAEVSDLLLYLATVGGRCV